MINIVYWFPILESIYRDSGQEEKGTTEDEMVGWHHRLDAHEFVWTPGVGDGQGGLACSDSWGHKESDTTERLNWTELTEVTSVEVGCAGVRTPALILLPYCLLHFMDAMETNTLKGLRMGTFRFPLGPTHILVVLWGLIENLKVLYECKESLYIWSVIFVHFSDDKSIAFY